MVGLVQARLVHFRLVQTKVSQTSLGQTGLDQVRLVWVRVVQAMVVQATPCQPLDVCKAPGHIVAEAGEVDPVVVLLQHRFQECELLLQVRLRPVTMVPEVAELWVDRDMVTQAAKTKVVFRSRRSVSSRHKPTSKFLSQKVVKKWLKWFWLADDCCTQTENQGQRVKR